MIWACGVLVLEIIYRSRVGLRDEEWRRYQINKILEIVQQQSKYYGNSTRTWKLKLKYVIDAHNQMFHCSIPYNRISMTV